MVWKMSLKNLNNTLIGKILIVISAILVLYMLYLVFITAPSTYTMGESVEWNGMHFYIDGDSECSVTNDSLSVTSKYSIHNVEIVKTSDLSTFHEKFDDATALAIYERGDGKHTVIESITEPFAIIVDSDDFDDSTMEIKDGAEIFEVTAHDSTYLSSFVMENNIG